MKGLKGAIGLLLLTLSAAAFSAENPAVEAHPASQIAADALREFANADGAFLAAGLVKDNYRADNLATLLQYPTDEIVLVSLRGSQIRQAFERSVSLHPQPNTSFLQISGFEVTFQKGAPPGQRIVSVTANGAKLDDERTYLIAMPNTLGRGGLGYFKIWDKSKIVKTFDRKMEDVLKGKRAGESAPRWVSQ